MHCSAAPRRAAESHCLSRGLRPSVGSSVWLAPPWLQQKDSAFHALGSPQSHMPPPDGLMRYSWLTQGELLKQSAHITHVGSAAHSKQRKIMSRRPSVLPQTFWAAAALGVSARAAEAPPSVPRMRCWRKRAPAGSGCFGADDGEVGEEEVAEEALARASAMGAERLWLRMRTRRVVSRSFPLAEDAAEAEGGATAEIPKGPATSAGTTGTSRPAATRR